MREACVLDASAAAAIVFREPEALDVLAELLSYSRYLVPQIFALELANVGRTKVRRGELPREAAKLLLDETHRWPLSEVNVSWERAWQAAWEQDLTVYDAAYLSLARDRKLPLITTDQALKNAATRTRGAGRR